MAVITYDSQWNIISSAATMSNVQLNGTGIQVGLEAYDGGSVSKMTIVNGGQAYLADGGSATDIQINSYGFLIVDYNGFASRTTIGSGGCMDVYAGGSADGITVSNGGNLYIDRGSVKQVLANGGMVIAKNADVSFVSNTIASANVTQDWYVYDNTTLQKATVGASGYLSVCSGGSALNVTMQKGGGFAYAVAPETYIKGTSNGSAFEIKNAHVSGWTLNECNYLTVWSGGSAEKINVNCGGGIEVLAGGRATNLNIQEGGQLIMTLASGTCIQGTSAGKSFAFSNTLSNWDLAAGTILVGDGGSAFGTVIGSGGYMEVDEGGAIIQTTVNSGGNLNVYDNGIAEGVTLNGGSLVAENALASNVTVINDGYASVQENAEVCSITVDAGSSLILGPYSFISGQVRLEETSSVQIGNNVNVEFSVYGQTDPDQAMVNKLYMLSCGEEESYSIAVAENQTSGRYILAEGASGFQGSISYQENAVIGGEEPQGIKVLRESAMGPEYIGDIYVGGMLSDAKATYILEQIDDQLILTVESVYVCGGTKSDVDGNGVSDVLFQYSGGDYRLGYWMNGTNEWQSENSAHPAAWEVLGAYDMNSDGNADAVYVGNVEAYGTRAAYIGYYNEGKDSDANWVNIGFLNNEADIDWKNKVGNLTGNEGANSIVWHAAELGALGVWTDGTDSWTSLGGGFNENWNLVGTGDFNGDGADSVLMSYNSGEKYYTVDLDGAIAELATSDSGWEVRAVGDFSGDGMDDIVAFHKGTGVTAKWENGDSTQWSQLGQLDASDWFVVGAGDYTGDGEDDLLVRQYSTGMLGYYTSGDMSQWNEMGRGVDMNWTVVA